MWTRVLMFGAMAAILVAAVTGTFLVLDVGAAPELRDALRKTLAVIAILTTAILLLIAAVKIAMAPRKSRLAQPESPPPA